MAEDTDFETDEDGDTEDFAESLGIAHHLAILDLIKVIEGMSGAPKDKLDEIRNALTSLLAPEDIEVAE